MSGWQGTPGPWSIAEKQAGANGAAIIAVGNIRVATISYKADKSMAQKWADAHGVAAVPQLVEALAWIAQYTHEEAVKRRAREALKAAGVEL